MNLFYIDCKYSGIAGDMFLAALHGLKEDAKILPRIQSYINKSFHDLQLSQLEFIKIQRNGVQVNKLLINFQQSHPELHVNDIQNHIHLLCDFLSLSPGAKKFASHWFSVILEAERLVHSAHSVNSVHLHELGSIDTLIDICGSAAYLDLLGVFTSTENMEFMCSEVAVGGGLIKIAHGTVPIPAPATLKIIENYSIPIRGGPIEEELFTPTGAALLATLIDMQLLKFSDKIPSMSIIATGQSTGNLGDENFPNIFRIYTGKTFQFRQDDLYEDIIVLETMVDDTTGETLGTVMDQLYEHGALDVNYLPVHGKKNRPGILIKVLTQKPSMDELLLVLFKQLGTLGVRFRIDKRICLQRKIIEKTTTVENVSVSYHVKIAYNPANPNEILFFKIEHDDIIRIARKLNRSLSDIKAILDADWMNSR